MLFNSEKGMSLIGSMLIAVPIMGLLVGTITFISNKDIQREKVSKAQNSIHSISSILVAVARHPNLCLNNMRFQGGGGDLIYDPVQATTAAGQPIVALVPGLDGGGYLVPNALNDENDFFMSNYGMRVTNLSFVQTEVDGNERVGDLVAIIQASDTSDDLPVFGPRIIGQLSLTVDGGNNISKCLAGGSPQQLCENLGGRYDPNLTPNCRMGYPDMACPAGQYIERVDAYGSPVCANARVSCDPATEGYLVGMVNGLKVCRRFAGGGATPTPTPTPACTWDQVNGPENCIDRWGALCPNCNCPGYNVLRCNMAAPGPAQGDSCTAAQVPSPPICPFRITPISNTFNEWRCNCLAAPTPTPPPQCTRLAVSWDESTVSPVFLGAPPKTFFCCDGPSNIFVEASPVLEICP